MVFLAANSEGKTFHWVRPLRSLVTQQLEGTEGAMSPFWSPDGRFIGYFANQKLMKVEASGGRPQTICDVVENRGGPWNNEGTIVFSGQMAFTVFRLKVAKRWKRTFLSHQ